MTYFVLAPQSRAHIQRCIDSAPDGYVVRISAPTRSLESNALMWTLLADFSDQLQWPVNGKMVKLTPEEFKDVLTAGYRQEKARLAMGLDGGVVMLGSRTSKFTKTQMNEFIEFIYAAGAERGVRFSGQEMKSTAAKVPT